MTRPADTVVHRYHVPSIIYQGLFHDSCLNEIVHQVDKLVQTLLCLINVCQEIFEAKQNVVIANINVKTNAIE